MKKYRTFGELLEFIREHLDECINEQVYFTIRGSEKNVATFAFPSVVLSRSYSDELLASPIDLIVIDELDGDDHFYNVILKVLF